MRAVPTMMTACATHLAASAQAPEGPAKVSGWMISDRRDADSRYVARTAFLFGDEVAVGFARDGGKKDVFAVERPEARLTEGSAYPVLLKADDGETLVAKDIALDAKMLIVPFQEPLKLLQKLRKGGTLYVGMHQEAAGSG